MPCWCVLRAGREDERRAEEGAERASGWEKIRGRSPAKPPVPTELVEPEVAEQVVEPGPEVVEFEMPEAGVAESAVPGIEAPAAEVPEAMPSPDDALAFLASLSAGQEDELRAQAEAEAAARLEEIMGRKPAAPQAPAMPEPEEARAELEAAGPEGAEAETAEAAQAEVAPVEVTPAEVPEVMPSPDDALAFLTRLSAGREDELRAQAETEAATRMDEIMGRKKPALPQTAELKPLEEPGGEAAVREPMAQVAAAEVIPKPPQAEVETAVQLPAQPAGAEEPMAFLQRLAEEKEAQLQAQPVEAPQPEMHVEVAVKVEAEGEPEPIAEQTVSLAVPVEAEAAEAEAVEAQAEVAEVEPTAVEEHVVAAPTPSAEWWVQIAEDEGEEPMAELPPMYQPPRPRPSPAAPRRREPAPVREPPPEAVRPAPAPAVVSIDVDPLLARLQLNENDHEARLELARAWWSTGSRDQALDEYNTLVRGGVHTDEVLGDLERIAEIDDHAEWSRLLGDVYMKAGKLPRALEAYRRALNRL